MQTEYIVLGAVALLGIALLFYFRAFWKSINQSMTKDRQDMFYEMNNRLQSQMDLSYDREQKQLMYISSMLNEKDRNYEARQEQGLLNIRESLKAQESRIFSMETLLSERMATNEQKVEKIREALFLGLDSLGKTTNDNLSKIKDTVDERLSFTISRRFNESFTMVSESLDKIHAGLGVMQNLSEGVGDLKKVLSNVKTRGIWGEIQLGAIIKEELSPKQYIENAQVIKDSSERVEFAIRIPSDGTEVLLPVDAKFPLESFRLLQEAEENKKDGEEAKAALQRDILREATRIASKYIQVPYTTDFAVMYLPLESLYVQVAKIDGLMEKLSSQKRVIIAGPTTFSALVTSLQLGFKTVAIQKNSSEIFNLLTSVKAEIAGFYDLLEKTGQKLRQAGENIDAASRKTMQIEKKLNLLDDINKD